MPTALFASDRSRPLAILPLLLLAGCSGDQRGHGPLTCETPLHLEEHLDSAVIEGSEIPTDLPEPLEWRFDEPQPDWRPVQPIPVPEKAVAPVRVEDALRLPLTAELRIDGPRLFGQIYVPLPDLMLEEWGYVEVRARAGDGMRYVGLEFNYTEEDPWGNGLVPFYSGGDRAFLVTDGTVQTYRLSLDAARMRRWEGAWTHLALWFNSQAHEEETNVDLLSVRVIPVEARFARERAGVDLVGRGERSGAALKAPHRRSLFMHAPGRIEYRVRVPESGRFDVGLGVVREGQPVTFRVTVGAEGTAPETLVEEEYADSKTWAQRSIDLAHRAGETVTLSLEAEAERVGTVALWAAPTLSGARASDKPNIVFYVIDGACADYMSLYGYNRRTTPNLERLAAEGAVFERAYSNSGWTRPSTASFLTSLQHSVLGGLRNGRNPVPDTVLTMAEHFHRAGYQTAEFTSNPNAGSMSNLDRGVDAFREAGVEIDSQSSVELHENFWAWRQTYPGEPYWVHFQTTDVHGGSIPVAPFAGLFIDPERRRSLEEWEQRLNAAPGGGTGVWGGSFKQADVSRVAYAAAMRDIYDETMAHQDYQIGKLVERLKAVGEWERTLLIIASDHGAAAATQDWGILMLADVPPAYDFSHRGTPIFRSGVSRIPLIVIWPERITPGQRFSQPVSMIDILPTVLDLADLPMPEVMQGQSLAPLLLGRPKWEPRPVILDDFKADPETGQLGGRIEVVDGRWGASLEINPIPDAKQPGDRRPAPLLLFDLWNDPQCLQSLHEERPDLVEKYTAFLAAQFEAHQALAQKFSPGEESPLDPEQLETLRSLGYIQ